MVTLTIMMYLNRLDKIEKEYRKAQADYLQRVKNNQI